MRRRNKKPQATDQVKLTVRIKRELRDQLRLESAQRHMTIQKLAEQLLRTP